jgi:hypothetical protein
MSLLSPLSLLWAGLLAPLVVLYVFKRRRQPREVGSTLLWELALRDLRAERPWKKLIVQLALVLQALAILAGALALARPAGAGRVPAGARVAVVIDTSASMAARAGAGTDDTRFSRAIRAARDLARSLPPGGEMMLVEAAGAASVIAPPTRDASALERALSTLRVRGGGADLEAAVAVAAERMRGAPVGSRIVLLTDAATSGELALDGRSVPVDVRKVGEAGASSDNTGIVAVDVRPRAEANAPDRADVFVRIARFARTPVELYVTATVEGRGVVASRRVTVRPGTQESVVVPADLPPDATGRAPIVRVELSRVSGEAADGTGDALPLDDVAVAPSPGARRLPVFLVGDASAPVMRALRADRDVELFATALAALAARESDEPLDGLVVYAGATPAAAPPGDSLVLAPTGDSVFGTPLGPEVRRPQLVTWEESDPRLRFVSFSDVHLEASRTVRGGLRPLISSDAGAVAAVLLRPSGETTLLAFDPARSDWPTRPSFVVFFRNLVERARAHRAAGGVPSGRTGEPLRVPAPDGTDVEVKTPGGETLHALSRGGVALVPTSAEPGVFEVRAGARRMFALRNLLDEGESDVRPRARFTVAGAAASVRAADRVETQESWPFVAAALLVLLALEALWATRKGAT